jgi:AraC-like DNA-binding protein
MGVFIIFISFALELLNEGKLSILQVALEVGYKDQLSFGRAFKKFFGFSLLQALKH